MQLGRFLEGGALSGQGLLGEGLVMGIQLGEPSTAQNELPGALSSHPNGTMNPRSWPGPGGH